MPSPTNVAAFHAEFDRHPDDRVRLFEAVADHLDGTETRVLYPGSYVDIAPSVWFDDVIYNDMDKRAARFFGEADAVRDLVAVKRAAEGAASTGISITFHHGDYREPIPVDGEVDLLVSLYSGLVSEYCTHHLRVGGALLVNPSHGDTAMATIDERYELSAVVQSRGGRYVISTVDLDNYLIPKKGVDATAEEIRESGRGIAYTRSAFAYLFTRVE